MVTVNLLVLADVQTWLHSEYSLTCLPYETPGDRLFNFKLFLTSVFYRFIFIYWHFGWWYLLFYFMFLLSLYIYFIYWCVFSLLFPVRSDCSQFISLYFFSTCRADISLSFIWCYVLWIYFKELIIVYFWLCFNPCVILYRLFCLIFSFYPSELHWLLQTLTYSVDQTFWTQNILIIYCFYGMKNKQPRGWTWIRFYWHRRCYQLCLWVISDHSACKKVTASPSLCMIFTLITKQETDASKNTNFYNMSVTCYFIMIHHSSQVIVVCLYEGGGDLFLPSGLFCTN